MDILNGVFSNFLVYEILDCFCHHLGKSLANIEGLSPSGIYEYTTFSRFATILEQLLQGEDNKTYVLCIDEFDEQRKFHPELLIHFLTNQLPHVHFDEFLEIIPRQETVGNN